MATLLDNLVAYYKCEEASDGDALADAHSSNNLTDDSGDTPAQVTGLVGKCRSFNGINRFFRIADNADFSIGDNDWTANLWIAPDTVGGAGTYAGVLGKYNDDGTGLGEYLLLFNGDNNGLDFDVISPASALGTVSSPNGIFSGFTFLMATIWHDSVNNQIGIAINAGTPNTISWSAGVRDGGNDFRISDNRGGVSFWEGRIDEIAIYKGHVLSSGARTFLYNGGGGRTYEDLASYTESGGGPAADKVGSMLTMFQ